MGLDLALISLIAEHLFLFVVMFIVTLAIVIILHEFGHYLAARWCGVHIQQFAVGFGPELFGFGKSDPKNGRYQTRWSVCLIPLGGFVKLFGDVDKDNPVVWDKDNDCERRLSDEELQNAFCTKSVWQRIFIVAAGPLINILFTFFLLTALFSTYGQQSLPINITAIKMHSAAEEAGVQVGDQILEMDGKPLRRLEDIYDITREENPPQPHTYLILRGDEKINITFAAKYVEYENKKGIEKKHGQTGMVRMFGAKFKDIESVNGVDTFDKPELARALVEENMGQTVVLGVRIRNTQDRNDQDYFTLYLPPEFNKHLSDPEHEDYGQVQFVDAEHVYFVRLPLSEAITEGGQFLVDGLVNTYKFIAAFHKGKTEEKLIGGVGTISSKTAEATKSGLYSYIVFLAGLSYMIGIINLLPIPVFDGGYLLFLSYEAVSGNPVPQRVQNIAIIFGLVFLFGIMIIANVSDVLSLFGSN